MLQKITDKHRKTKYISHDQASMLRDLILRERLTSLLELGTFHGKSTTYLASFLEEQGEGHITTLDRDACLGLSPNVEEMLEEFGLRHRATIRLHPRTFTMTLMQMLEERPLPQFDFCYFDGAHTWDGTGFCFLLVDLMLKPGAWVVFDDLDWTLAGSVRTDPNRAKHYKAYTSEEMEMPQVRKVFEVLVKKKGYKNMSEPGHHWGVAQKPY